MRRRRFITTAFAVGGGLLAGCIDGTDRIRWSVETDGGVFADPVVVDGAVYTGTLGGDIIALDGEDGEELWDAPYEIGTSEAPGHLRSAVSVAEATLYYGSTAFTRHVNAIDTESGDPVWAIPHETRFIEYAPTTADGTVFAVDQADALYAIDAGTGELAWPTPRSIAGRPATAPVVVDEQVIVAAANGVIHSFDIDSGERYWDESVHLGSGITHGGLVVADETLFVGTDDGELVAIDLATRDPGWEEPFTTIDWPRAYGAISTIPTVADGVAYATTNRAVFAVDTGDGTLVWDEPFDPETTVRFTGAPTVADGHVFVGTSRGLMALEAGTGEPVWDEPIDTLGAVRTDPIVVDGVAYIGTDGSRIYAVETDLDTSSDDARVNLGITSHHDTWAMQ